MFSTLCRPGRGISERLQTGISSPFSFRYTRSPSTNAPWCTGLPDIENVNTCASVSSAIFMTIGSSWFSTRKSSPVWLRVIWNFASMYSRMDE